MSPPFVEAFGRSLKAMRAVFAAGADSQPFVCAGSGTLAMEMAVANLVEPGTRVLVLWSGYFSDRMAEILRRYGAEVTMVHPAEPRIGRSPSAEDVEQAIAANGKHTLLCATHVDTSTAVRVDAEAIAKVAQTHGMLSVFDGVCATGGERFEMSAWNADVYLTASQKALGVPPGLALLVVSQRAIEARKQRRSAPPPLVLDWEQWLPIMQGYEAGAPKYFATPATSLVLALDASLSEILELGLEHVFTQQREAAITMRSAWKALGLRSLADDERDQANTLSALYYPQGVDSAFLKRVAAAGVSVAGGLLAPIAATYFRVGHMGHAARTPEMLERTLAAIRAALT
jgi:alanine-glyoxylate transaminase/serine-glyoxylate transaminase/serine-pyruvate transaminase